MSAFFHFIIFFTASSSIPSIIFSVSAESYSLQLGVESSDMIRAGFTEMHGMLDMKQWEKSSSSFPIRTTPVAASVALRTRRASRAAASASLCECMRRSGSRHLAPDTEKGRSKGRCANIWRGGE